MVCIQSKIFSRQSKINKNYSLKRLKTKNFFYFQPSHEAHDNVECRLSAFLSKEPNQATIGDLYTLRSSLNFNQSHVLTLLHSSGIKDHWHAHWLSQIEVAPPTTMLFQLIDKSADQVQNMTGSVETLFHHNSAIAKNSQHSSSKRHKFCKKVWERAENLKNRRHTHKHKEIGKSDWESNYRKEHDLCFTAECRAEIRRKCLEKGQKVLGPRGIKLTDCLFPIKMANIFQRPPKKPLTSFTKKKCWNLPLNDMKNMSQCLVSNLKTCKFQMRAKKPNWKKRKVAKKCQKRAKVEKCMVVRRQISKRFKSFRRWNRKRARHICKQRSN